MSTAHNPIVLAFSGGLDTSFCVPWLKETYQRPVVTVTVDCGGIDAAAARALDERARAPNADKHRLIETPVQRLRYSENEANYCPTCQTDGRLLADRSLSRLLKDDWPRTLDELEQRKLAARR